MKDFYNNNMNFLTEYLYQPVAKSEDEKVAVPSDWRDYPASRSTSLAGVQPPAGTVLVRTGGNALQAVDRKALEQDNVMAVTVPWNARPGDEMLVRLPHDRMIRTRVPEGSHPGHVFLVQIPEPKVATGVLVDWHETKIVPSQDVLTATPYVPPNLLQEDLLLNNGENISPSHIPPNGLQVGCSRDVIAPSCHVEDIVGPPSYAPEDLLLDEEGQAANRVKQDPSSRSLV